MLLVYSYTPNIKYNYTEMKRIIFNIKWLRIIITSYILSLNVIKEYKRITKDSLVILYYYK